MASQIAHIVYAKKYFEKIENQKINPNDLDEENVFQNRKIQKDEFFLGVVFPDIRMVEPSIKRKDTHLKFLPLDLNFSGLTSFEAGWKFHLFCDMRREEILNENGFYNLKNADAMFCRPAKLLEDELVYDMYNNWEKLANYFRNPPVVNLKKINIDRATFTLWYAIIAKYIEEKVTAKSTRIFLSKLPKLSEEADMIMSMVGELAKNAEIKKKLLLVQEKII